VLQKILIATGDSPESAEIFKYGLTLAEKYGAQISILHVLSIFQNGFEAVSNPFMGGTYPMMNDLAIQQYQKELQDREQQGMEKLESYAKEATARNIKAEIYQNIGDAGRTICETAKNYSADVIVMGRAKHLTAQPEIERVMTLVKQRDANLSPAINRTWTDSWGRAEVISIYQIESGEMSGRTTDGVSSRQ
jgi:nucleotide-binding universal stress UspA family protein